MFWHFQPVSPCVHGLWFLSCFGGACWPGVYVYSVCFDEVHVKTLDFSCVDFTFSVVLFALFMFAFCFFGFAVLFVFSLSYSHLFVLYLPIISSNLLSICESLK